MNKNYNPEYYRPAVSCTDCGQDFIPDDEFETCCSRCCAIFMLEVDRRDSIDFDDSEEYAATAY